MMLRSFAIAPLAVLATAGAASSMAKTPAVPAYVVSMEIRDGDKLIGQPHLNVLAAENWRIMIGDGKESDFTMSVVARPVDANTVSIASVVDVLSHGTKQHAAPNLTVALGKPAELAFGEDSATTKPVRIKLTVTPTN